MFIRDRFGFIIVFALLVVFFMYITFSCFRRKRQNLQKVKRALESQTWNSYHEVTLKKNKSACLAKLIPIVELLGKMLGIYMSTGISALHNLDFGEIFDRIDTGMDGKLSYDDLNVALKRQQRELKLSSKIYHLTLL